MYSSLQKAKQILSSLEEERDLSYAHFLTDSIKVSSHPESILGIRMGVLRSACKNLAKVLHEEEALTLLYPLAKKYYEYKIVFGGVVERVAQPLSDLYRYYFHYVMGGRFPTITRRYSVPMQKRGQKSISSLLSASRSLLLIPMHADLQL